MNPSYLRITTGEKLTRARTRLVLDQPFFWDAESAVETPAGFVANDGDGRHSDRL